MRPGPVTALCISYAFPDCIRTLCKLFDCSRVQPRQMFSSGFVLKHLYIHANAFTCRNLKSCHFENSYESERASGVAAPFVCSYLPVSLFSSAVCRQTMKRFSVLSQSWATAFSEDKHNISPYSRRNPMPMAFFLLPVVQSHAEDVHSLCIVTFKMLLQHLTCFLLTFV